MSSPRSPIDPVETLVRFGRALRAAGLPGRARSRCLLLARRRCPAARGALLGRAGDAALRPEQIELYDALFAAFFGPPTPGQGPPIRIKVQMEAEADVGLASPVEHLKDKSFSRCSREELSQLAELMSRIELSGSVAANAAAGDGTRGSPGPSADCAARSAPAASRSSARGAAAGGPGGLVLLLDVSGSMDAYSRALVMFAHAALRSDKRWEAFCFGTRLTRVTRQLEGSDADAALGRAAAEVVDWDGGTRIGESLKRFLDEYGHSGLARGAVVVLCSDGLEVGDPELLAEQMARLHRLAYRVVWLNPSPGRPRLRAARARHEGRPPPRRPFRQRPQPGQSGGGRRGALPLVAQAQDAQVPQFATLSSSRSDDACNHSHMVEQSRGPRTESRSRTRGSSESLQSRKPPAPQDERGAGSVRHLVA